MELVIETVTADESLFGTSGIRGEVGETITPELALSLGQGLATIGCDRVVVGRDPRASGHPIADALVAGLTACGSDVVRLGLASTPTVARGVRWKDADVGVAVTASHNPPEDNGLKFWTPSGQAFDSERRAELIDALDEQPATSWDDIGRTVEWSGAERRHIDAITRTVEPVEDCSVVVDVGNGVGGLTAAALIELGCDVETLNARPDGRFPARPSEPTAEHCQSLSAFVESTDADLGIAHDGDADRMMAVAADGTFLAGDQLLALFASETASHGDRVAVPINTSSVVDDALTAVGADTVRTPVGDVFVAERAAEDGVVFGGEPSGAWIWPDQTLCPDGPLAACQLVTLVARGGSLSDLVSEFGNYVTRRESVRTGRKHEVERRAAERLETRFGDAVTIDGTRVEDGDAWALVRASGTQPLVRITVEAETSREADTLLDRVRELVGE